MTLREAFDQFYRHDVHNPNTLDTYLQTLVDWEKRTDNPPVEKITNEALAAYKQAHLAAGNKPATFNGKWRNVRAILRRLGPQEWRNPGGLGILARIPYVKQLKEDRAFPRIITSAEFTRLYLAASHATWPRVEFYPPSTWWRGVFVLGRNAGPRPGDLFSLLKEEISLERKRLQFKAAKVQRAQIIPLNLVTLAHLKPLLDGPHERLFPFGDTYSRHIYRQFRRLQEIAGVWPFNFYALRKTCGSLYANRFGRDVAEYVLGHSIPGTTARYYINPGPKVRRAVKRLPQPAVFREILKGDRSGGAIPRRSDFQFSATDATYRGKVFPLPPRLMSTLRAFVTAGRPLGFDDLRGIVFWDLPTASRTTIKTTVHQLRRRLQETLGLPQSWNPLSETQQRDGWYLFLP